MRAYSPLVSVIIPSKNRLDFIEKAIDSILGQTYRRVEVIVVDDGSEVPLSPVLTKKYGESIVCLSHEQSRGAPASRNTGAKQAKGEYLAFLDDDDIWLPEKLEKQMAAFASLGEAFGVVYCGYDFWIADAIIDRKNVYYEADNLHEVALAGCPIGSPTPVIKKRYFEEVGGFDDRLPACQDWDLWIRLSKVCLFYSIRQSLAQYGVHGEQISTNIFRKINARKTILEKYRDEISECPKILSKHYQRIGSLLALVGENKEAKSYFWESVRADNLNLASWVHLLLQFGCSRLQRLLIDKYGATRVGKFRIYN
jgi:glycosyltransferase involved in cell wall biosynthesis